MRTTLATRGAELQQLPPTAETSISFSVSLLEGSDRYTINRYWLVSWLVVGGHKLIIDNWHYTLLPRSLSTPRKDLRSFFGCTTKQLATDHNQRTIFTNLDRIRQSIHLEG